MDSISRDSVDPVKIVVVTAGAVYTITYASISDISKTYFSNLQPTLTVALTVPTIMVVAVQGLISLLFFVFSVQIHHQAPKRIKRYSRMSVAEGSSEVRYS